MTTSHSHVVGLGLGDDDLHCVGWTQSSIDQPERIVSELLRCGIRDLARWIEGAMALGRLSLFEIEPAASLDEARDRAISLCGYFRSLGLDVIAGGADGPLAVGTPPSPRRPQLPNSPSTKVTSVSAALTGRE